MSMTTNSCFQSIQHSANKTMHRIAIPLRSCAMTKDLGLSCCIEDEGRPLGIGDRTLGSNRPVRHSLRVFVVSDKGKGRRNLSGKF